MVASDNAETRSSAAEPEDALVSRLALIEEQPLDTRADAYAHLHEQLRARLEGGDQPERHA
jgi:hypothetical protein